MSFGASPSDIIIVVTFCKALYRKCRDAGGEYDEISREVRGLHTVLRHLKYEVEAPESPLNRDRSIWGRQLAPTIGDCDVTLRQLDTLLQKYGRLSDSGTSSPSSPRILWEKIRFGSNEMDTLGTIRVKLISHKTSLTLFLDTIQLHQSGKVTTTLDTHSEQLDVILDKVDNIAARMGQGNRSILTSYEDDDKEVWKQFRRELVAEGFSSDVLTQHKDVLRAYIREIDQNGGLDEVPPPAAQPVVGATTERWLEAVQSPPPSERGPPSFDSLHTATDDSGAKEMMVREENMKFPQSMKFERPKPETRRDGRDGTLQRQLEVPPRERTRSVESQRQTPVVPRLITSSDERDGKEVQYYNTDGSSDEDSENELSPKRSKSPQMGLVIRTSELVSMSQALQVRPSLSPTTSFRSSQGSFEDHDAVRSIAQRQKKPEFGSSPGRTGSIPISPSNPRSSSEYFGTSPRPDPMTLAPDEHGNTIPPDAKWTKVTRRLISPEVLDQDRRRYEARPDFVAILGVLSRVEIESLAARSQELREARLRRNQPQPQYQSEQPPPKPPRPVVVPVPIPITSRAALPRSPASSRSESSSDSESDDRRRHRNRRSHHSKGRRAYAASDTGPVSGYPNAFGQAPPSPVWSPTRERDGNQLQQSQQGGGGGSWQGPGKVHFSEPGRKDSGRERDRERRSSRHSSYSGKGGEKREVRDLAKEMQKDRKSRWKENLSAGAIGGAAVSLLNVLSEAAEGL